MVLKVVHINVLDKVGGAARVAFKLHTSLKEVGHDSRLLVGFGTETSSYIDVVMTSSTPREKLMHRAVLALDARLSLQYLFLPWGNYFLQHPFIQSSHIINIHNIHGGYFPFRIFPKLSRMAPIVWTLHDMWALTGHCIYSYHCERWRTKCGKCPFLSDYPALKVDTTMLLWRIKNWIYRQSDLTLVTPSRWLAHLIRQSPLLSRFDLHWIPYGINIDVFKPIPKREVRQALGLPVQAQVVLFGASSLTDRRKGALYLRQALQELARLGMNNIVLLTVGSGNLSPDGSNLPYPVQSLGMISNDQLLAACYSAADVYVLPTLADNLPMAVIESMACGTPVISFQVGGVPETVRHMETGYLVTYQDPVDLAIGIQRLLKDSTLRSKMGLLCRKVAEQEYSEKLQTNRYTELYYEVLRRHRAKQN